MFSRKETMRKAKLSLIASVAVGLLAVTTAGVSTYAWFNSVANITVSEDDKDLSISVAAPEDIEISNTQVYMYRGNPSGTSVAGTPYTLVSTVEARTIDDFYPGEQITFAIKVTTGTAIDSGSMDLTYRGFSLANRVIQSDTSKVVNILSAIKVSAGANGSGSYPGMTQILTPLARGSEYTLASLDRVGETDNYYKENTISDAVDSVSIGTTTGYFFYTIEFLNVPSTFYKETTIGGDDIYVTPSNDSATRYFSGNNAGSSTCYERLNFDVTSADITII